MDERKGIKPGHKPHTQLEDDVTAHLEHLGCLVDSAPYHDKMNPRIVQILQNTYAPTALYLRSRADRIAIHPRHRVVFEWEAKTHNSSKYHDCCIEALPVCVHLALVHLGVKCLYVYRDPQRGYDTGFWVSNLSLIRAILIPTPRWTAKQIEWFQQQFAVYFPNTPISKIGKTLGTDDPFLIIDESEIMQMPHWKKLIESEINHGNGRN